LALLFIYFRSKSAVAEVITALHRVKSYFSLYFITYLLYQNIFKIKLIHINEIYSLYCTNICIASHFLNFIKPTEYFWRWCMWIHGQADRQTDKICIHFTHCFQRMCKITVRLITCSEQTVTIPLNSNDQLIFVMEMCFLWGTVSVFKFYLEELWLQRVKVNCCGK
jgi:hypothetical protein